MSDTSALATLKGTDQASALPASWESGFLCLLPRPHASCPLGSEAESLLPQLRALGPGW